MSTRHLPNPVDGLRTLVRLYPWSVLWILFATAMAVVVGGSILSIVIVFVLILAVVAHSAYREHLVRRSEDHP